MKVKENLPYGEILNGGINLYNGDCLEIMESLVSNNIMVDAIITDPPYGTTACKWDSVIDFELMWKLLNRIIKPNGAIVLFGSQPFTSALIMSNPKMFRYDLIFRKTKATGFLNSKRMPLREHEEILVFYKRLPVYNPQKVLADKKDTRKVINDSSIKEGGIYNGSKEFSNCRKKDTGYRFPKSILKFKNGFKKLHPTQKPVKLMEYLIKTYTNENELVLDFTMGSGTTGVACKILNRNFIGIEKEEKYFKIAKDRINKPIRKSRI